MNKLKSYLWQNDFETYFRHPNQTGEDEFLREKRVESDFPVGYLDKLGLEYFFITMLLSWVKFVFFVAGEYLKFLILYKKKTFCGLIDCESQFVIDW